MMKKVWLVLLAVVLVFGLAFVGCGGGGSNDDDDEPFVPLSFEDFEEGTYKLWGIQAPVYEDGFLVFENITKDTTSKGFKINFADIGYTYRAKDVLIFTYEIEVTTPEAVFLVKSAKGDDFSNPSSSGGAGYGIGKGWEYILGSATAAWSNYEGPLVNGTFDADTGIGTFEVLVGLLSASADGVGFQHNVWADNGGGPKIAENSEYKIKFLKIENKTSDVEIEPPAPPAPPPPPPELPTGSEALTVTIGETTQSVEVSVYAKNGEPGTLGYLDDEIGYIFIYGDDENDDYGHAYTYFALDFTEDSIANYNKITFKYKGLSGDIGWKSIYLFVSDTEFDSAFETSGDAVTSVSYSNNGKDEQSFAFNIDLGDDFGDAETLYFAIIPWLNESSDGVASSFQISDIVFVEGEKPAAPYEVDLSTYATPPLTNATNFPSQYAGFAVIINITDPDFDISKYSQVDIMGTFTDYDGNAIADNWSLGMIKIGPASLGQTGSAWDSGKWQEAYNLTQQTKNITLVDATIEGIAEGAWAIWLAKSDSATSGTAVAKITLTQVKFHN